MRYQVAKVAQFGKGIVRKGSHLRDRRVEIVHQGEIGIRQNSIGVFCLLRSCVDVKFVTSSVDVDKIMIIPKGEGLVGSRYVKCTYLGPI